MGIPRVLVFLFLHLVVVHGSNNCQTSFCSLRKHTPIRFPFRLPDQPQDCGYPGFDLSCNDIGMLVLNLKFSGSFFVLDIDYKTQIIEFYDPKSFTDNQFWKLNLSSSPFTAVYYMNYTTFPIYMLEWDSPDCKLCEVNGIFCEFKDNTSQVIRQCPKDPPKERTKIRLIVAAIMVPIISCLSCIICYKCMRSAIQNNTQTQDNATAQNSMTIRAHVAPGLDDSTIESYATVILGESGRIAGPNGTTCPICLADYLPKDILRSIPECQHCFHADCIDKWLRLKSMCPICRNSPS